MNRAAGNVCHAIRRDGTQQAVVDAMQTRTERERDEGTGYRAYEEKLDASFAATQRAPSNDAAKN